jgi:hypothetical protein
MRVVNYQLTVSKKNPTSQNNVRISRHPHFAKIVHHRQVTKTQMPMDIAVDFLMESPVTYPAWLRGRSSTTASVSSLDGTKEEDVFLPGSTNRRFRQRHRNRALSLESATPPLNVSRYVLGSEAPASTEDEPEYLLRGLSVDSSWSAIAISRTDDVRPLGRAHTLKPATGVAKVRVSPPRAELRQRALKAPSPGTFPQASRPSPLSSHLSPLAARPSYVPPTPHTFRAGRHFGDDHHVWCKTTTSDREGGYVRRSVRT